jgi:hypothetical protein
MQVRVKGIGPTQRIQFATNESKLLPRNLYSNTPHLKSTFQNCICIMIGESIKNNKE